MKYIFTILDIIISVYRFDASPNLFGSKKRRRGKASIANEFKAMAGDTATQIEQIKSQNPFESAAAKSAMTQATRNAKQMEQRTMNMLGAGASPEAIIAAQGRTGEALGAAAGQIAVGAEGQRKMEEAQLRGEKMQQMGQYAGMRSAAEDERGSGWTTLFQGIDALGNVASGIGGAATGFKMATGGLKGATS